MTDPSDANALDNVKPEHVLYLTAFATKNGCTVTFAGQCGIGRDCVGILRGGNYLDYSHLHEMFRDDPERWALWWAPEDAYHKHDCMAVLGRGPAAVGQLYAWAKWLDEHGWSVTEEYREPKDHLDAVFHGLSTPKLMPPARVA